MEGHGIQWWEPPFEGMCFMHGMCFDMLTPMLYISVCRKMYGVVRDDWHTERKPTVWIVFGLYLGVAYCEGLYEGAYFSIFLCRIGQEHADPGEEQDPRSDGFWWKGYSRGRSW